MSMSEDFLEWPGNGENSVYSPVGVNITFNCAVNNTNLFWVIDRLVLNSSFQSEHVQVTSCSECSDGVIRSSVTVLGSSVVKSNSRICCQSHYIMSFFMKRTSRTCTNLILYGELITL